MLPFVADFTSGSLDTLKMEGQVEQTALWDIVFQCSQFGAQYKAHFDKRSRSSVPCMQKKA